MNYIFMKINSVVLHSKLEVKYDDISFDNQ